MKPCYILRILIDSNENFGKKTGGDGSRQEKSDTQLFFSTLNFLISSIFDSLPKKTQPSQLFLLKF